MSALLVRRPHRHGGPPEHYRCPPLRSTGVAAHGGRPVPPPSGAAPPVRPGPSRGAPRGMTNADMAIVLGTPDIAAVVGVQIVEELETVAAPVEHINQTQARGESGPPVCGADRCDHTARGLGTARPEQTLPIRAFAALGGG